MSFPTERNWGWKDPRNSLTLRFWQGLLPKLKVIIMVRNPLEVAYSMREAQWDVVRFWPATCGKSTIAVCLRPREIPSGLVTHYDSFFANPETELRRIAAFAGLALPAGSKTPQSSWSCKSGTRNSTSISSWMRVFLIN